MASVSTLSRKQISKFAASDPLLLDFLKPFPNLLRGKQEDADLSFDQMAKKLSGTRRTGVIQFRLTKGRRTRYRSLALSPKGCQMIDGEVERVALEFITSEQTWMAIAGGQVSLLEAFAGGKLRVRGDIQLARSIVRRIHRR